jgi:anti-anti-sigma factor
MQVRTMQLPSEVFGNVVVVHSPEELGVDQAENVERFLADTTPRQIVLDMDNTELLDSQGLTAVLNAYDLARKQGGNLKIATTNGANRKILEITRLDQQLDVFDSVIDAVKSFRA